MNQMLKTIARYLRSPVVEQLDDAQADIEEELRFHLQARADEYHQQGMSTDEATEAALTRFGDVNRIANECRKESSVVQVWLHRSHMVLTASLLVATAVLAFRMFWETESIPQPMVQNDADVAGLIVDELGKPIGNVDVLVAVKWWPERGFRQQSYMTKTDSSGHFSIDDCYPCGVQHEVLVAAVADGHLLTSNYISDQALPLDQLSLELPSATARLTVEFKSPDGEPVAGVSAYPKQRTEAEGDYHLVYPQTAEAITQLTNESGRMELANFKSGDRATLAVRFPDTDWEIREVVVPENESVVVITQNDNTMNGG